MVLSFIQPEQPNIINQKHYTLALFCTTIFLSKDKKGCQLFLHPKNYLPPFVIH